jgi:hypothetical protein
MEWIVGSGDLGYDEFIPATVQGLLEKYGLRITDFNEGGL